MLIGVISDTHGFLDPQVLKLFANVEHILHGGDIGPVRILHELEQIAPVTAVSGNTDLGLVCPEFETVVLAGRRVFVQHIVDPDRLDQTLERRLRANPVDVVVFGHTHQPYARRHGETLFLNPGSAGRKRFNLPRTVALLRIENGTCATEFKELAGS